MAFRRKLKKYLKKKLKNMKSKLIFLLLTTLLFIDCGFTQPSDSVLTVLRQRYDKVLDYSEGLTMVGKQKFYGNNKGYNYGFVDNAGNVVIPLQYMEATNFKDGLSLVRNDYFDSDKSDFNDNYGFIDKTGKVVIPLEYNEAYPFAEGLAAVKLDKKWGFIDKTGKIIIPFKYNEANSFTEGLACVNKRDKYGYINKNGEVVIPFKYYFARSFSEGLAMVSTKLSACGFIDKLGKEVIPLIYDQPIGDFKNGLAFVGNHIYGTENWEFGYVNKNGEVVIPIKYSEVKPFTGDFAYVNRYGVDWSAINRKGETLPYELYFGVVVFYSDINFGANERINIKIYSDRDEIYNSPLPYAYKYAETYSSKWRISKAIIEKYSENPCKALLLNSVELDYTKMDSFGIYPALLPPGKYKFEASGRGKNWKGKIEVIRGECKPLLLR